MIDMVPGIALLVGIVVIVLLTFYAAPARRSKQEEGLSPLYEERCVGRRYLGFGFFGGFTKLRVSFYENFVVVTSVLQTVIPYHDIKSIEYKELFVSKGMIIYGPSRRSRIALFPRVPQRMLELFGGKGVSISAH